jgi:hypothetical protein
MFIYLSVEYPGEGLDGAAPPCDPFVSLQRCLVALPAVAQQD